MALPSSGELSLNEIHIEAGGSTGTECTINDTDIRALIGAASGSEMEFADWYGASSDSIGDDWDGTTGYTAQDYVSEESQVDVAQVVVNFNTNGTWYLREYDNGAQNTTNYNYTTGAPSSDGSNYEIKWVLVSGTAPSYSTSWTENTFLSLGTGRYLSQTDTVPNNTALSTVVDITIQKTGDSGSAVTNRITLQTDFQTGIAWGTTTYSITSVGIGSSNQAGLIMEIDGDTQQTNISGSWVAGQDWSTNPGGTTGSEYEIYWTKTSGIYPSTYPTENTWLPLSTQRQWSRGGGGSASSFGMTLKIRCYNQPASEVSRTVLIDQEVE